MKRFVFILLAIFSSTQISADSLPDFGKIKDVKQKKAAFFNYMYPLILAENKKILAERYELMTGAKNSSKKVSICKKYSSDCKNIDAKKTKELLLRVDVIPPSLALAQGANESAWGTSRFAKKANNLFGQWCYKKGCGIVPAKRNKGTKHEVRKFASPQGSVGSYIFNLNTSSVYKGLRKQRAELRAAKKNADGYQLAAGLIKYSQRREAYVKEIRSMISYNKLVKRYDEKFWGDINKLASNI